MLSSDHRSIEKLSNLLLFVVTVVGVVSAVVVVAIVSSIFYEQRLIDFYSIADTVAGEESVFARESNSVVVRVRSVRL